MRVLFCTILFTVFTISLFLYEFKWKVINPNGFVKSYSEQSLIIETIKQNEAEKNRSLERITEYSYLNINVK